MARVRSAEYDDKRAAILGAAAALFARHGFDRTSISTIARRCNASKAWLYHYYDSKEALLYDLLEGHIRGLLETVRAADEEGRAAGAEPRAHLRTLVRRLLAAYRDADDTHKVQLNDLGLLPAAQQRSIKQMEREIVEVFAAALAAVNPALRDRPALLKPATMSLFGMLNWHFTWFREGGALSLEDYADLATRLIVEGVEGLV